MIISLFAKNGFTDRFIYCYIVISGARMPYSTDGGYAIAHPFYDNEILTKDVILNSLI